MPPATPKKIPFVAAKGPSLLVQPGCSILLPDMTLVTAGQAITPSQVSGLRQVTVDEWLRDGKVVHGHTGQATEEVIVPIAPGAVITPLPTSDEKSALEHGKEAPSLGVKPLSTPVQASEIKGVAIGKWNIDPATLVGKDLAQLNAMVLDKDSTVQPFETIEEAIPFLSQHFVKPS